MRHLALIAALALAGCASGASSPTPAAQVYATKNAYAAVLTAATVYNRLTPCPAPAPCRDASAVLAMRSANNTAIAALDTAETIVRAGNGPAAVSAAQTAAQAVATFQAIVNQYKGG